MSSSPSLLDAAPMASDDGHEDRQVVAVKRKRNLPGTPDPDAEVIALSPKTLMATNRFLCEVCGKGFQRDQNLQLHRRGHNLPWKLKQRDGQEVKRRVYVCPEPSCIHHDPSRALGDLTGIKKHFSRKHGEKKWKCEKCSKQYAVHSDWKAHQKVCGTREYRCACGTLFSRRDSFVTHRAFCDALAQEHAMAAAHRLAETQQSSETGGNAITSPARDLSSVVDASPLSFQHQTASNRPNSDFVEPLGKDVWEASSAVTEYKGPKGLQYGLSSTPNNPMRGPGLSLTLGTGLGPGPPCPSRYISSLSRPLVPPLSNMMNKLVDTYSDGPAEIAFPLPVGSAGMYTNLLAASSSDLDFHQFEKGAHGRIGDTSLSMAVSTMTDARAISEFANSTYSNSGIFSPKHQRQHTGSAQLPATTLLQKAAIMGVAKSKTFLFQSLGDLCSISFQDAREHNTGASATTSSSSSLHSLNSQQGVEGLDSNCGSRYAPEGRQYFSDGSKLSWLDRLPSGSSSSFSSMKSAFLFDGQTEHKTVMPSKLLPGSSRLPPSLNIRSIEVEEAQQRETGILTLDFLGVGDRDSFQEGSSSIPSRGARPGCLSREDDT